MLPLPLVDRNGQTYLAATVWTPATNATNATGAPSTEDLALIMHRVAALEKDVVKIEGLWDKDKGQRVIEVWMSLLKKTTFKPSNW